MSHLKLVPPDDAFAYARFTEFHDIPRPDPLKRVAIGGESATAQLDRTVQRLREREGRPVVEAIEDGEGSRFDDRLHLTIGLGLICWFAVGIVFAWLGGRL